MNGRVYSRARACPGGESMQCPLGTDFATVAIIAAWPSMLPRLFSVGVMASGKQFPRCNSVAFEQVADHPVVVVGIILW